VYLLIYRSPGDAYRTVTLIDLQGLVSVNLEAA
jgi:hypothetical protein